jgi:hypothetical protein
MDFHPPFAGNHPISPASTEHPTISEVALVKWFHLFSRSFVSLAYPAILVGSLLTTLASAAGPFQVTPAEVSLQGNFARTQLLVSQPGKDGSVGSRSADLTHQAKYISSDTKVVTVVAGGRLLATGNGKATIAVTIGKTTQQVPVLVEGIEAEPNVEFAESITPVLNKLGCNMGACHASQYGKGGFKLSVFGFEPAKDRIAIVRERQQRRVNLLDPEKSLILRKATMRIPHGGGKRVSVGSADYQLLVSWLKAGAPAPQKDPLTVERIEVFPKQRISQVDAKQQLRVDAYYSDGSVRDVTAWSKFDSVDDSVVNVSADGVVSTIGRGQGPAMVRFEGQAVIAIFVVPYADKVKMTDWQNNNFVDELAAAKFNELGITPSALCDDSAFLRRAYLDATGTLPPLEETRAFLASKDSRKREHLIDRLLGLTGDPKLDIHNDAYAAFWTLKWSDLIRNQSNKVGEQGMWSLHNWIRESFRVNKNFDKFVSELVTAQGSIYKNGPANYFRINANSNDLAESTAQLFLGARLQCAKCHHHPFEKYSQADYYGFAAFFSRVGSKTSQEFGLFGREQVVMVKATGEVRHPKTRKNMPPTALDGTEMDHPLDRRIALASWLTSKDNTSFARSVANRYTSYLLGRGLVDPVDDMRATNPPTNPELLDALAKKFTDSGFDIKQLMRTIMVSRLYQLDSQPTESNLADERFYSHFKVKRLSAEALLDAVDSVTGVQTKFKSLPLGTRAIELPDAEYPNYFLTTFAKPRRASVCECERTPDESLAQALHTLNGDILALKIANAKGRLAGLQTAKKSHDEIVDEIFLVALARYPSAGEKTAAKKFLSESPSPKECYEDLLWALMNSKQFLFVR